MKTFVKENQKKIKRLENKIHMYRQSLRVGKSSQEDGSNTLFGYIYENISEIRNGNEVKLEL